MICSDPSTNRDAAKAIVGTRGYAPVTVTITKVSGSTVVFTAPQMNSTSSGTFSVTWGDISVMWSACPSTVAPNATPDNLTASPSLGQGSLYLYEKFMVNNNIPSTDPKWPTRLAGDPIAYKSLDIFPTAIMLVGTELLDGNNFSDYQSPINLLDPNIAAPGQQISTSGGTITLQLTQDAFSSFNLGTGDVDFALEAIRAQKEPIEIARGWQTIAVVLRQLQRNGNTLRLSDAQKSALRTLLPGHDL